MLHRFFRSCEVTRDLKNVRGNVTAAFGEDTPASGGACPKLLTHSRFAILAIEVGDDWREGFFSADSER